MVVFVVSAMSYDLLEVPILRLKNRFVTRHADPDTADRPSGGVSARIP